MLAESVINCPMMCIMFVRVQGISGQGSDASALPTLPEVSDGLLQPQLILVQVAAVSH